MNANLENRVSMYFKVREFFENNSDTLTATASALVAPITDFNTQVTTLATYIQQADTDNSGYTLQKKANRDALRDLAMSVAGALNAVARIDNDLLLVQKSYTTKSTLDAKRDTDMLFWCETLRNLAIPKTAQLAGMGVTAGTLTDFSNAIAAYSSVIQDPADQRSLSAAALVEANKQTDVIDNNLKIIDAIMQAIAPQFSLLYNQYKFDRLIDDNASSHGEPDVIEVVQANSLESIFTAPYNPVQKFKLKNTGSEKVLWGLSESDAAATSPLQELNAGSTSEQLSSSLADGGDFLVVQNQNAQDITVELTLL